MLPVAPGRRDALLHQGDRHPDRLQPRRRGRLLHEVPVGAGLRELVRADTVGALERRDRAARRDNQGRQRARAHGAHRVRMALLRVLPETQGPRPRHRRAPGDTLEGGRPHRQAPPPPRGAGRGGQERMQGKRRRGARARPLGLGDRAQIRGNHPLAASDNRLTPGGPAPRRIAGASSQPFLWAAPGRARQKTGIARSRRTENRNVVRQGDTSRPVDAPPPRARGY